jgi:nucleotide-binding universal stress UspA family protein
MNLLLAYDGLPDAHEALEKAAELANEYDGLTVLTVVPPDGRRGAAEASGHVGYAGGFLRLRGVEATTKVAYGDPAEAIVAEAARGRYDAIVMGTRELSPLGRLLMGSVTRNVIRHAPCKVIVAGALSGTHEFEPALAPSA